MDAFWQIMGYHTYPASNPSVRLVKAKMPFYLAEMEKIHQLCDLLVYFSRRDTEHQIVYTKWYDEWDYSFNPPK